MLSSSNILKNSMRNSLKVFVAGLLPVMLGLSSCGGAKFSSGGSGRQAPPATPTTPTSPPPTNPQQPIPVTPAPETPVCTDTQKAIGANIAFLIDNSSSNSETDCPGKTFMSQFDGVQTFSCSGETNREKAVLAAFDLLAEVSAKDASPAAASNIAIVGFPAANNAVQTVQVATNGWVSTRPVTENRAGIQTSMQFTRQPMGATPYGTAISAAQGLFASSSFDGRAKVAVLVTDGEPTDRDPIDVAARAQSLRQSGVEVITVYIAHKQTRSQREAAHQTMLTGWEQRSQPGHYYNGQRYQSFDAYLNDIFGRNGRVSLADAVTSSVVPTCVDAPNSVCQRWKVEIPDSTGLANVVKQIIRTRAVKCQ